MGQALVSLENGKMSRVNIRVRRMVARRTSHHLTYRRTNHKNLHVRGYKEEGTTTMPRSTWRCATTSTSFIWWRA